MDTACATTVVGLTCAGQHAVHMQFPYVELGTLYKICNLAVTTRWLL
jgi:hypothetical protein